MAGDFALIPDDDDQKLLAHVIDYYQRAVKESSEALEYLKKRGITNGEALDVFRIGYADRTLGLRLPSKKVKAGNRIRKRLEQLGVYRASGHEHFNGCVTFPVTAADGSGRIVDIYGRKTRSDLRKGTPLDMHLDDKRRGVWNIQALRAGQEIILSPTLFDALTFWSHGYRNVTCTFGPESLTDDHLAAFAEFGIRRVLVSVEAIAPKLLAAGIEVYLMRFPQNMDANKHAQGFNDPARTLGVAIRRAEWLGKGESPRSTVNVPEAAPTTTPAPVEQIASDPDAELAEQLDALDDAEIDDEVAEHEEPADDPPTLAELPIPILTASPLPPPPQDDEVDQDGDEVAMTFGNRRYRVRGLAKNLSFDQLKVNVLISTEQGMYVDTFDLYVARHRKQFVVHAAIELSVQESTIKKDVGRLLLKLEELQDEQILHATEPQDTLPTMTVEEKEAALKLLRDPHLLDRIVADFDVVGETTNKLVGYLAAVSRKLDQPLKVWKGKRTHRADAFG